MEGLKVNWSKVELECKEQYWTFRGKHIKKINIDL